MDPAPDSPLAHEELLEHVSFVRQLARGLVYGEDRVEEVVQQSFLRAIKSPPRHRGNLRSWFAVVVRNVVYRDASRARIREDAQWGAMHDEEVEEAVDRAAERADLQRSISEAVYELPEVFRTIVMLRYFDELSIDEIAEQLGIPRETVRSRQRRGLARLREQLARRDRATGGDWRASAIALLAVPKPAPEAAIALGTSWWSPLALVLPLALIGGAWWWMQSTDRAVSDSVSLSSNSATGRTADEQDPASPVDLKSRRTAAIQRTVPLQGSLTARVLSMSDGRPIPAAELVAGLRDADGWWIAEPITTEAGDCSGPFRFVDRLTPDNEFYEHAQLEDFESFLCVRAAGFAPLRRFSLPGNSDSSADGIHALGDLRLERGIPVRGRVAEHSTGVGVGGARLWLSDDRGSTGSADRAVLVGATQPDGSFQLDELVGPNRVSPFTWTLFASHEGRAGWLKLQLDELADELDVAIDLGPYASLEVTLLDEHGVGVEGARVRIVTLHAPWSKSVGADAFAPGRGGPLQAPFEAFTDESGKLAFDALPARDDTLAGLSGSGRKGTRLIGPYQLWIDTPSHSTLTVPSFVIPEGERSQRTIQLAELIAVDRPGRVLSAFDGRVLRDAWVRATDLGTKVPVDALGNFRLPADFPRYIDVGAPGHTTRSFDWTEAGELPRDCELERAFELRGRVMTRNGARLSNLLVHAAGGERGGEWNEAKVAQQLRTHTDALGGFHFDGLSQGDWQITVELPPGSKLSPPAMRWVAAGSEEIEFVLEPTTLPTRDVLIRVVDATTAEPLSALDADLAWIGNHAPATPVIELGFDTVFLRDVRVGEWRMWTRISGRGASALDFTVEPGEGPLKLQLECGSTCRIEGQVVLPAEAGVPRDWIVASIYQGPGPPRRWPGLRTEYGSRAMRSPVDEAGNFAMNTVVAGPYRLELIADEFTASTQIVVEPGSTERCSLRAERAGELVLRGSLPAAEGLALWLSDGVGGEAWHWLRPETVGAAWEARRRLPPGEQRWALALRSPPGSPRPLAPGPELVSGRVQIRAGEAQFVEVDLGE